MNIEKKFTEDELAKMKSEDEKVTKLNDEAYKKGNIESVKETSEKFKDAKGNMKEKFIEHVTYRNGVVKSRITSLYKNGKLLYTVAPKKSDKRKGK